MSAIIKPDKDFIDDRHRPITKQELLAPKVHNLGETTSWMSAKQETIPTNDLEQTKLFLMDMVSNDSCKTNKEWSTFN